MNDTTVVAPGETFTVSAPKFQGQSVFTLTNGGGTESESITTSCAQVLQVGDVFGSLTLVAFNGNEGGNQVTYHYNVTNTGATTCADVNLNDDKLGDVCNPVSFSLEPGATATCTATTEITEDTTNTVTASATGASPVTASATVAVALAPCATGADSLTVKDKEVRWKITNGTDSKLTIAEIIIGTTIPWPSANRALDQVKLDAEVIAGHKIDFPCCSADITTFDKDVNKRSIDHNKSKTLKFKFREKAVATATHYQIEVLFTNGCTIHFP